MLRPKHQGIIASDTTGSNYPAIPTIKRFGKRIIEEAAALLPAFQLGLMGVGDVCDWDTTYVTRTVPFDYDLVRIVRELDKLGLTGGGDSPEDYGLMLAEMNRMPWDDKASKWVIIFSDATPHERSYYRYDDLRRKFGITPEYARDHLFIPPNGVDWREEARNLRAKGVTGHVVQCLNYRAADEYHAELARLLGGRHVRLHQIQDAADFVRAFIAFQAGKVEEFIDKFRDERGINRQFGDLFQALTGRRYATTYKEPAAEPDRGSARGTRAARPAPSSDTFVTLDLRDAVHVDPARFQRFVVGPEDHEISLKDFARKWAPALIRADGSLKTGLIYNRVDEALGKKAQIRPSHDLVVHVLETGEYRGGDTIRIQLGCGPKGSESITPLKPWPAGRGVEVLKQSNSSNRGFDAGTVVYVDIKSEKA